jgi:hypothetical protein
MTKELQIKAVMTRFLKLRATACGLPLQSIKTNGGLTSTGALTWKLAGAYLLAFDETTGNLSKIVHRRSGDEATVAQSAFNTNTPLRYNWSEWRACFPNPPLGDTKLHLYFKKAITGPWTPGIIAPEFNLKSKEFALMIKTAYDSWKTDLALVQPGNVIAEAVQDLKKSRDEQNVAVKRTRLSDAREKGMAAMKKRREAADVKHTGFFFLFFSNHQHTPVNLEYQF